MGGGFEEPGRGRGERASREGKARMESNPFSLGINETKGGPGSKLAVPTSTRHNCIW